MFPNELDNASSIDRLLKNTHPEVFAEREPSKTERSCVGQDNFRSGLCSRSSCLNLFWYSCSFVGVSRLYFQKKGTISCWIRSRQRKGTCC